MLELMRLLISVLPAQAELCQSMDRLHAHLVLLELLALELLVNNARQALFLIKGRLAVRCATKVLLRMTESNVRSVLMDLYPVGARVIVRSVLLGTTVVITSYAVLVFAVPLQRMEPVRVIHARLVSHRVRLPLNARPVCPAYTLPTDSSVCRVQQDTHLVLPRDHATSVRQVSSHQMGQHACRVRVDTIHPPEVPDVLFVNLVTSPMSGLRLVCHALKVIIRLMVASVLLRSIQHTFPILPQEKF
jgi:hypothetical protein